MQTTSRRWATAFAWLGAGTLVGAYTGGAALWIGIGVLCAGLLLTLAVPGGDATLLPGPAETRRNAPSELGGLGTRVEQILRLAEEQADDHLAEARKQAQEIVAAAHAQADRVRGDHR